MYVKVKSESIIIMKKCIFLCMFLIFWKSEIQSIILN